MFLIYPGYEAVLSAGSGVTILKGTGPNVQVSIGTVIDPSLRVMPLRNWKNLPRMFKKLVGYGYLVQVGDKYKVTPEGMGAR